MTDSLGVVGLMTSPAAGAFADAVLAIPIGATEQHGPHLPLSTDTHIAVEIARRLRCVAAPECVVVAPAVSYGSSGEHAAFPGTLSIGNGATELLLVELVRSATDTWSRILLISTHGGNAVPVRRAVAQLRSEGRDVRAWSPAWPGDAHAGHTETSVMLCIDAARVDREAVAAGALEPLSETLGTLRAAGVGAVSPNGVLGDPTGADPAHGRQLLETAIDDLLELVVNWPAAA